MNEITFSKKQLNAIDTIVDFALNENTKNIAITLTGSAGTGKTTIVKEIRNRLMQQKHNVILIAPTNKASIVLQIACNTFKSYTIHSFLGLKPITFVDDYDANNIKFISESETKKEENGLLIIDECSMIDDNLYDRLIDFAKEYECKILFVGDIKQLKPINNKNKKSKSFTGNNVIELTEIFRQDKDSKMLPILQILRDKVINKFVSNYNKDGGIVVKDDKQEFINSAIKAFSSDNKSIKLLAFANDTIATYNNIIFNKLFPNSDNKFPKGCILTGYNNIKVQGVNIINNSSDYVVLNSKKYTKKFKCNIEDVKKIDVNKYISLDGYLVTLQEIINGKLVGSSFSVFIHDSSDMKLMSLLGKEHAYRRTLSYYNAKIGNSLVFDMEAAIVNTHAWYNGTKCEHKKTLDYGYASTVHKAQGSTYENIFVDVNDICFYSNYRKEDKRELLYTGLSRTKHFAYIYPDKSNYSVYLYLLKVKLNKYKNNIIKIKQKYIK